MPDCLKWGLPRMKMETQLTWGRKMDHLCEGIMHEKVTGYLLQSVGGRPATDNTLMCQPLCGCCWHGERWRRKLKCLINCLSLHIDQTQHTETDLVKSREFTKFKMIKIRLQDN